MLRISSLKCPRHKEENGEGTLRIEGRQGGGAKAGTRVLPAVFQRSLEGGSSVRLDLGPAGFSPTPACVWAVLWGGVHERGTHMNPIQAERGLPV